MSVVMRVVPQANKFEQVSSDDHQKSVAVEWRGRGPMYKQTTVKTIPSCNFICRQ